MLVGEVYAALTPVALTLSDGSPVFGSTIATKDCHVSVAYCSRTWRCCRLCCSPVCALAGAASRLVSAINVAMTNGRDLLVLRCTWYPPSLCKMHNRVQGALRSSAPHVPSKDRSI